MKKIILEERTQPSPDYKKAIFSSLTYKKSSAGLQLESANLESGVIRADVSNSGQYEVDYFLTDYLICSNSRGMAINEKKKEGS